MDLLGISGASISRGYAFDSHHFPTTRKAFCRNKHSLLCPGRTLEYTASNSVRDRGRHSNDRRRAIKDGGKPSSLTEITTVLQHFVPLATLILQCKMQSACSELATWPVWLSCECCSSSNRCWSNLCLGASRHVIECSWDCEVLTLAELCRKASSNNDAGAS